MPGDINTKGSAQILDRANGPIPSWATRPCRSGNFGNYRRTCTEGCAIAGPQPANNELARNCKFTQPFAPEPDFYFNCLSCGVTRREEPPNRLPHSKDSLLSRE